MRQLTKGESERVEGLKTKLYRRLLDVLFLGQPDVVWDEWAHGFVMVVLTDTWTDYGHLASADVERAYWQAVTRYNNGAFHDYARGLLFQIKACLMLSGTKLIAVDADGFELLRDEEIAQTLAEAEEAYASADRLWEVAEADARKKSR